MKQWSSLLFLVLPVILGGCSSTPSAPAEAKQASSSPGAATSSSKNPLAKYIELAGFRLSESGAGKMKVKFTAINHSDADLGDLTVKSGCSPTSRSPEMNPLLSFRPRSLPLVRKKRRT